MNVNFEAIEKAWGKPKKDKPSEIKILDELEKELKNTIKEHEIEDTYFDSDVNRKGYILSIIAYLQTILDTLIGSDE